MTLMRFQKFRQRSNPLSVQDAFLKKCELETALVSPRNMGAITECSVYLLGLVSFRVRVESELFGWTIVPQAIVGG